MTLPGQQDHDHLLHDLLVARAQTGDRAALEALVERHHRRLGYFLRKLVRPPSAAEDLQQDVWLTVYQRVGSLREPAAFLPWLYRIARNRVAKHLGRSVETEVVDYDEVTDDSETEDPFERAEDAARVHAALDRLPLHHREALMLFYLEDMNYQQIADALRCPVGTVRSRLHHGKTALRRLMEQDQ